MSALLFIVSTLISTSYSFPQLGLIITPSLSEGIGFYSIDVGNEQWLQSGQLEGYLNGKWYTSNQTKANDDKNYSHMKIISNSTINNVYDEFSGNYTLYIFEWQADTIIFETNFKIYSDGTVLFIQSFPNGVPNTNFMSATIPSGCDSFTSNDVLSPPILSFPSFNVINMNNKYANKELGYLTWTNTFSEAHYDKTPISTDDLAGINGGPVVLYDNTNTVAILISTNDNFDVSTQLNQLQISAQATFMNDSQREDSLFCISEQCYDGNEGYQNKIKQGGVPSSSNNNNDSIIPLTLWFSPKYNDNYVATTTKPPDNSYTITFANGYLYSKQNNHNTRLSVDLYYSSQRHDHATAATENIKNNLKSMGYTFMSSQGYIDNDNMDNTGINDWRLGISSQVMQIPKGFEHETVIVIGNNIHDVILNEWSSRLTAKYNTSKLNGDADIVTAYLGYWTDDGAYYYGDGDGGTTPKQDLSCCSLDVFKDVKKNLDFHNIPIKYWQMDDWWYK
eukprot:493331_1